MKGVVLSLFPGADLLGRAFEAEGFCVVRGPDILWGGDIQDFHVPAGVFDGVIGGPPCQFASRAAMVGTRAVNLIPEYLRLVCEARPEWAVMENVVDAIPYGPDWPVTRLRDWDCGGLTHRVRAIWVYGLPKIPEPPRRGGQPAWSVMATSWKGRTGKSGKGGTPGMHQNLAAEEAARLQGFPGLAERIMEAQPAGVSESGRRCLAIHMLGNGVPLAMGRYIARYVSNAGRAISAGAT